MMPSTRTYYPHQPDLPLKPAQENQKPKAEPKSQGFTVITGEMPPKIRELFSTINDRRPAAKLPHPHLVQPCAVQLRTENIRQHTPKHDSDDLPTARMPFPGDLETALGQTGVTATSCHIGRLIAMLHLILELTKPRPVRAKKGP